MQNFSAVEQLFMDILHLNELGDTERVITNADVAFQRFGVYIKCRHECSLGVYLVIDNVVCSFRYFTSVST